MKTYLIFKKKRMFSGDYIGDMTLTEVDARVKKALLNGAVIVPIIQAGKIKCFILRGVK